MSYLRTHKENKRISTTYSVNELFKANFIACFIYSLEYYGDVSVPQEGSRLNVQKSH